MPTPLTREQKVRNERYNQGFEAGYHARPADAELYRTSEPYFRGYDAGIKIRELEENER